MNGLISIPNELATKDRYHLFYISFFIIIMN